MDSNTISIAFLVLLFLVLDTTAGASAAVGIGVPSTSCDPDYQCQFTYVDANFRRWQFDLSTLCSANDYVVGGIRKCCRLPAGGGALTDDAHSCRNHCVLQVTDPLGHNYTFNICGLSHFRCNPVWKDTYQFGVAVQVSLTQDRTLIVS